MEWILSWIKIFWEEHGVRFVFGTIAMVFAVFFMKSETELLQGAGFTIAVGTAMTCYNKMRGTKVQPEE